MRPGQSAVVQPPRTLDLPLPPPDASGGNPVRQAVVAARRGDAERAVQALDAVTAADPTETAWLALAAGPIAADLGSARLERLGAVVESALLARSDRDPVRRAEALLATTVTGLLWPALPSARRAWARGLVHLAREGAARVHADGTPADDDDPALLRWLELGLVLARLARDEGLALPDALTGAMGEAAAWLHLRSAPFGDLDGSLLMDATRLPSAARNASLAAGWSEGRAAPEDGALARWLGHPPPEPGEPPGEREWTMWAFRAVETAVLHRRPRKRPSRLIVGGRRGIELTVDGVRVLEAQPPSHPLRLASARVDGRTATMVLEGAAVRRVQARMARLICEDRAPAGADVTLSWPFGPDWTVDPTSATHPVLGSLRLILDDRLEWKTIPSAGRAVLVGQGRAPAESPLRTSFEWT